MLRFFFKKIEFGIFSKLIGAFIIVILPVLIISLMMNNSGTNIVKRQSSNMIEQKINFMMASIETEMVRISELQREFLNDNDLQVLGVNLTSLSKFQWVKAVNNLYSKLSILRFSSKFINDAIVFMPQSKEMISAGARLEPIDMKNYEELKKKALSRDILAYSGDQLYMIMGFPTSINPQFLLVLKLSREKIQNELKFFQDDASNGIYLVGDHESFMFSTETKITDEVKKEFRQGRDSVVIHGESYMVFRKTSPVFKWKLVTIYNEKQAMKPVREFSKWYWIQCAIGFFIIVYSSYSIYRLIHKPVHALVDAFKLVEEGQLDLYLHRKASDEFKYLYEQFNRMVKKLRTLIEEVYQKTILHQKSELKHLQSQINPHFLYNSLYVLYRMAQDEDFEGVSSMSKHLGDYFKYITKGNEDTISLVNEINHAKAYMEIQRIRFGNRIGYEVEISGSLEGWKVPRLIIQPLVENAFVHGLKNIAENGHIRLTVISISGSLFVEVADNGLDMSDEGLNEWNQRLCSKELSGESDGLLNVHRRLNLVYGMESGLMLYRNEAGGVTVKIEIRENKGENS